MKAFGEIGDVAYERILMLISDLRSVGYLAISARLGQPHISL